MLIVWGRYAMQHPRESAALERCGACRAQKVERRTVERMWHFCAMPIVPGRMSSATVCGNCKHVEVADFARGTAPRRLLGWRVLVTWALIAAAVVFGVLASSAGGTRTHAWAAAPAQGDHWSVDLQQWPGATSGIGRWGVFEVTGVDEGDVTLGACDVTFTAEVGPTPRECTAFPIGVPEVKVADVPLLLDKHAILSIWRAGAGSTFYDSALGVCIFAAVIGGLMTWRAARRSWKPGDPLPRAAVVK